MQEDLGPRPVFGPRALLGNYVTELILSIQEQMNELHQKKIFHETPFSPDLNQLLIETMEHVNVMNDKHVNQCLRNKNPLIKFMISTAMKQNMPDEVIKMLKQRQRTVLSTLMSRAKKLTRKRISYEDKMNLIEYARKWVTETKGAVEPEDADNTAYRLLEKIKERIQSGRYNKKVQIIKYIRDNADISEEFRIRLNEEIGKHGKRGLWDTLKSKLRRKKTTQKVPKYWTNYDSELNVGPLKIGKPVTSYHADIGQEQRNSSPDELII
jgi:hypothetical protein